MTAKIVREEWQMVVKKYLLLPGTPAEALVSSILKRLPDENERISQQIVREIVADLFR